MTNPPGDGLLWLLDTLGSQLAEAHAQIEKLTAENAALTAFVTGGSATEQPDRPSS